MMRYRVQAFVSSSAEVGKSADVFISDTRAVELFLLRSGCSTAEDLNEIFLAKHQGTMCPQDIENCSGDPKHFSCMFWYVH